MESSSPKGNSRLGTCQRRRSSLRFVMSFTSVYRTYFFVCVHCYFLVYSSWLAAAFVFVTITLGEGMGGSGEGEGAGGSKNFAI